MTGTNRSFLGFVIFIVGFTAGATFATLYYLQKIQAVTERVNIKINEQYIVADVVNTEEERNKGLSGRETIGLNDGMYFIFDEPGVYGFWMKNMKFPIDIVWIAGGRIIGFNENVPVPVDLNAPDSELASYLPPEPVDRVLELRAGRARLLRASIGDYVMARPLVEKSSPAAY
jgi:hypothetical protein